MDKDRGVKKMMHVWNLYSNLLMHMQVELLEAGPGVAACAHAAAAALLPRSPSLWVCSHGFSPRHGAASTISTAIYGNPLSSQRAVTSRPLTSRCSDDTRRAYAFWLLLL